MDPAHEIMSSEVGNLHRKYAAYEGGIDNAQRNPGSL